MMYEIHCKECKRYLGKAYGTLIAEIKCSNSKCKADNKIKVVTSDSDIKSIKFKFEESKNG